MTLRLLLVHGTEEDRTGQNSLSHVWCDTGQNKNSLSHVWYDIGQGQELGQRGTEKAFFCSTKIGGTTWDKNDTETKMLLIPSCTKH